MQFVLPCKICHNELHAVFVEVFCYCAPLDFIARLGSSECLHRCVGVYFNLGHCRYHGQLRGLGIQQLRSSHTAWRMRKNIFGWSTHCRASKHWSRCGMGSGSNKYWHLAPTRTIHYSRDIGSMHANFCGLRTHYGPANWRAGCHMGSRYNQSNQWR